MTFALLAGDMHVSKISLGYADRRPREDRLAAAIVIVFDPEKVAAVMLALREIIHSLPDGQRSVSVDAGEPLGAVWDRMEAAGTRWQFSEFTMIGNRLSILMLFSGDELVSSVEKRLKSLGLQSAPIEGGTQR
ncbi:MAG: hypothetical protein V4710_05210 [Verrucomicrobiota bacterium]